MDRILVGTSATISATFAIDGVATDPAPDTCTLQLINSAGVDILPAGTATINGGVGIFTKALAPAQTPLLDSYRARWTASIGGNAQTIETRVEVVGGFLFSIAEGLARIPNLTGTTAEQAAQVATVRTEAEQDLERACGGLAFVPRYSYERRPVPANGRKRLRLKHGPVRSVRSLTIDTVAWPQSQIDYLVLGEDASLRAPFGWYSRYGAPPLTIGYEYGLDFPERPVTEAALDLAVLKVADGSGSGIDPRTVRVDTQDGSVILQPADGLAFGLSSVDLVVNRWCLPLVA